MTEKWENILKEAESRLNKGDIDGAIRRCDEVINLPENTIPRKTRAAAFGVRGTAYMKKGDIDRAISNYDEAIKLDPENTIVPNNRGIAYEEKGDLDLAFSNYDEAIKLDSKNAAAFNNRGNIYAKKKDFELAIRDYDEAIKLDSKYAAAFSNRGNAYLEKGNFALAIHDYDEAIRLDSKDSTAFNNRGNAYKGTGDLARAIRDYDDAIKIDPKFIVAFHNRALAYGLRAAQADEKKFREEYERELQKLREQSERQTEELREQLRRVSDPAEITAMYKEREDEYKKRIGELAGEIKTFAGELRKHLVGGFAVIAILWFIFVFPKDESPVFAHGFALTSLILAWLVANYPAIGRLNDMRKEKHKKEICAEDCFRKLILVLYTLAPEGDERQKMMAITHAHFATRSAAEFLADWNQASDDKSNPLLDVIEKILRRKNDDSPQKPPSA